MGTNVQAFGAAGQARGAPAIAVAPSSGRPAGAAFSQVQQDAIGAFAGRFGVSNPTGFSQQLAAVKQAGAGQQPLAVAKMVGFLQGQWTSGGARTEPHGAVRPSYFHDRHPHYPGAMGAPGHRHAHCGDGHRSHGRGGAHEPAANGPNGAGGARGVGGSTGVGGAVGSGRVGGGQGPSALETQLLALFDRLGICLSPEAKTALHRALEGVQPPIPTAQGAAADPASVQSIRAA